MQKLLKFKIILYFSCLCVFMPSYAQTPGASLEQLLQNIDTYQADFVQTVMDDSKLVQQSSGKFFLLRPGKFRWDVQSPNRQLLIAKDKRLWIYDPDLEQVTVQKVSKAAGATPALLLSGDLQTLNRDFTILAINKRNQQGFELTPKNFNEHFKTAQLYFNHAQLQEMSLEDQLGHITKILFKHIQVNQGLDAKLFNFIPPKGVDIINNDN